MKYKPSFPSTLPTTDYFTRNKPEPFIEIPLPPEPVTINIPKVPYDMRDRHIHVLGKTGYGKTTLLADQAVRDIRSRKGGVCVIDPKGGLESFSEIVSRFIPEDRIDDCIWLDIDNPIPLDVISCDPGKEDSVVRDLSYILSRGELDKGTAPELSSNIDNVIYTLLNANNNPRIRDEERCTFIDIYRFFREPDRQKQILSYVTDPTLRNEWSAANFPKDQAVNRITTRINQYFRSKTLRTILGEPKPRLNIQEVIDNKKILLVAVPDENPSSSFYGSLLVSKIQHAAFSSARGAIHEEDRIPFFLYIDEFEYFRASEAFGKMLKMARSFKLCLTLANLQLNELDKSIVSALGLISTYILLKIDPEDKGRFADIIGAHDSGEALRKREQQLYREWTVTKSESSMLKWRIVSEQLKDFPEAVVTIEDAIKLSRYQAIYKIGDDPPIKAPTPKPPSPKRPTQEQMDKLDRIRKNTKERYGPTAANYAEIIKKRTVDNEGCNSGTTSHTQGNGNTDTDPAPEGTPDVPSHKGKNPNPRKPR